jgi:hypothetical protein
MECTPGVQAARAGPLRDTGLREPPAGSKIGIRYGADRTSIVLPRAVLRGRVWLIFAFGAPFIVIPAMTDAALHNLLIGLLLHLVGLVIVAFGVCVALFRQVVREDGSQLVFEIEIIGRLVHSKPVLKRNIRSVTIQSTRRSAGAASASARGRPGRPATRAVYVEAEGSTAICVGPCLDGETLDWLRGTLELLVAR